MLFLGSPQSFIRGFEKKFKTHKYRAHTYRHIDTYTYAQAGASAYTHMQHTCTHLDTHTGNIDTSVYTYMHTQHTCPDRLRHAQTCIEMHVQMHNTHARIRAYATHVQHNILYMCTCADNTCRYVYT